MVAPAPATLSDRAAAALQRSWEGRGALSTVLLPAACGVRSDRRGTAPRCSRAACASRRGCRCRSSSSATSSSAAPARRRRRSRSSSCSQRRGYTPGIVSRGYGAQRHGRRPRRCATPSAREVGDEPLLLQRRTGVPVAVGADRVGAGHALLRAHPRRRRHRQRRRPAAPARSSATSRCWSSTNAASATAGCCRPGRCASRCRRRCRRASSCSTTPTRRRPAARLRWRSAPLAGVVALDAWWHGAAAVAAGARVAARPRARRRRRHGAPGALLRDAARRQACASSSGRCGDHADFATLPWPASTRGRRS